MAKRIIKKPLHKWRQPSQRHKDRKYTLQITVSEIPLGQLYKEVFTRQETYFVEIKELLREQGDQKWAF